MDTVTAGLLHLRSIIFLILLIALLTLSLYWTQNTVLDAKGKGCADGQCPMNAKATAAAELAKCDTKLQALYVVVPPSDKAKQISCPICKEMIKSKFLKDNKDWVWKNIIMKDDQVGINCGYEECTSY